jgi:hypothetical protein
VFAFLHWLDGLEAGQESALWVAFSIVLYLVCAQLAWRTRDLDNFLGENIRWLGGWRFRRLAWQLLRFLFYVIIPYGLLVQRRLFSGQAMGLLGPKLETFMGWTAAGWLRGLGWAAICGTVGFVLLGGSWWALTRRLDHLNAKAVFYLSHRPPIWQLFWDALFLQVHWAFYRAAAETWLGEEDLYWSVFLGLVLVALEAAGDPSLYFDRQWPSLASGWVRLATVAWVTAIFFLLTQNLYLGVGVHWGLTWTLNAFAGRLSRWSLSANAEPG